MEEKTISRDIYYYALALFMLASRKRKELDALEQEMNELLNEEQGSHLSDAIYMNNEGMEKDFKRALQLSKINVELKSDK